MMSKSWYTASSAMSGVVLNAKLPEKSIPPAAAELRPALPPPASLVGSDRAFAILVDAVGCGIARAASFLAGDVSGVVLNEKLPLKSCSPNLDTANPKTRSSSTVIEQQRGTACMHGGTLRRRRC